MDIFTLDKPGRLIVKIGSSLLVDDQTGRLNQEWLSSLGADIARLHQANHQVLVVSSGAIALGCQRLALGRRTLSLAEKQACAATGQALLTQAYENVLAPHHLTTAQALLTLNDTEERRGWINARETLETLLRLGAIPIINENDTVATDEIRYGDNDRLAARVAQMLSANVLVLLSDIDGLYDKDPAEHKDAHHIPLIHDLTPEIMSMGGPANQRRGLGSGGMATKLQAARIAMSAGCHTLITKGQQNNPLTRLLDGQSKASWFHARTDPLTARKQWIAGALRPKGTFIIDEGAVMALKAGKSLLAVGLKTVMGDFEKGEAVRISDRDGQEIGMGLSTYKSAEAKLVKGLKSADIENRLGYNGGAILIHRDNLVLH